MASHCAMSRSVVWLPVTVVATIIAMAVELYDYDSLHQLPKFASCRAGTVSYIDKSNSIHMWCFMWGTARTILHIVDMCEFETRHRT